MHWACQHALFQVQEALDAIIRAFPKHHLMLKLAKFKMKMLVFPWGKHLHPPSDTLGHTLVSSHADAQLHQHLIHGVYQSDDANDITASLQHTLVLVRQAAIIEKRLRHNGLTWRVGLSSYTQWLAMCFEQGALNSEEKDLLARTAQAVEQVIKVDDF